MHACVRAYMCNLEHAVLYVMLSTGRSKTKLRIRRLTSPHTNLSPRGHR